MTLKLAFSTIACPDLTLTEVAEKAEAWGYQGVELRTLGAGGSGLSCDPALSDAAKVGRILSDAGIAPVCLSTSLALHHSNDTDIKTTRFQVVKMLEAAAAMGAPAIRVFGNSIRPGQNMRTVIQRIADNVQPLAENAADLGVQILFENAGSFASAKQWWWVWNQLDHPMVGMAWNVATAAAAGEPSMVSVPMLNSRIRLAKVADTIVGRGVGYLQLGEGDVGIEPFIQRLLGVGYRGYVSVEWDRLWLPALAPADEVLPEAAERLKGWLQAATERFELYEKTESKQAEKNAPKPRAELVKK